MSKVPVIKPSPMRVQAVYLILLVLNTFATALIWGIDTLFLLDAGLTNAEAFLTNAFFTVGQVIFEVPTGIVADVYGRRTSYLMGSLTLAISTLLYLLAWKIHAPLAIWAMSSMLLGLGFTFFSGATEAWLVDALEYAGFKGSLESVFAKGQILSGIAMLSGAVLGGVLAQFVVLSVPYMLRAGLLILTFIVALFSMKEWGFEPKKSVNLWLDAQKLFVSSAQAGWSDVRIRWVMLAGPFVNGVSFYTFYALQPFLLQLYGNKTAYGIAGLAAATVAAAQIIGGLVAAKVSKNIHHQTRFFLITTFLGIILLASLSLASHFMVALGIVSIWGLVSAAVRPVRQAYLNTFIPSKQRATMLSFDSLLGSSGGVVIQPLLGKVADKSSYAFSFVAGAGIESLALPLLFLADRSQSDPKKDP